MLFCEMERGGIGKRRKRRKGRERLKERVKEMEAGKTEREGQGRGEVMCEGGAQSREMGEWGEEKERKRRKGRQERQTEHKDRQMEEVRWSGTHPSPFILNLPQWMSG